MNKIIYRHLFKDGKIQISPYEVVHMDKYCYIVRPMNYTVFYIGGAHIRKEEVGGYLSTGDSSEIWAYYWDKNPLGFRDKVIDHLDKQRERITQTISALMLYRGESV